PSSSSPLFPYTTLFRSLHEDRLHQRPVDALEPIAVDLEQVEGLARDLVRDLAVVLDLRDVADPSEDPIRERGRARGPRPARGRRSEEHTSELQSRSDLV